MLPVDIRAITYVPLGSLEITVENKVPENIFSMGT
jgi:hypothetical protein